MVNSQIKINQNKIFISGELSFATVEALLASSQHLFPQQDSLYCDLSQVTSCDSAGLALLVEWLKFAQQKKIKMHFIQIPHQLQTIIAAARLNKLFS